MSTFIQKNKKKSALAALLLFLRTRKTVTALLLLAVLSSFLFVSPSNIILAFPGGARLAAGVAWIAGKAGMDTSKWGLAGGKRDYNDLVAAFRAAKDGGGKAGWSAFMQGAAPGAGAGGGSLDFVSGSRKDLEVKGAAGEKLGKAGTVQGVLNPDDAKNRGEGEGVALSEDDLHGNEGLVKSAFAGGFSNTSGFSGGSGAGVGAYAGGGFFGGTSGSAASAKLDDRIKAGLDSLPKPTLPKPAAIAGGTHGRLSGAMTGPVKKSISKGMLSSTGACSNPSQKCAFYDLATANGRSALSIGTNCNEAGNCPAEFAAVNTGIVYDGGKISGDGTGLLTTVHDATQTTVPLDTDVPPAYDPAKLMECTDKAQACEKEKQPDYKRMSELQQQLNGWYGQMGSACGDPCDCGPCNNLKSNIKNLCNGELKQVVDRVQAPCDLPSYCAELGVSVPSGAEASATMNMCKMNMGECGCDSFFCDLGCMLGS